VKVLQIYYDEETKARLDPAFEPLDNSGNERPEWYEYWPISRYLTAERIVDDEYYGFFSPRFGAKTLVSGREVIDFVSSSPGVDVVTFSAYHCLGACFFSVFEQGEYFHPGLVDATGALLAALGDDTDPKAIINHSRNIVYSNYFVAKGWFWKRWLAVLTRLFEITEKPSPARERLLRKVAHQGGDARVREVEMRIFVMERMASYLMATMPGVRTCSYKPFAMPVSSERLADRGADIVRLDALKLAYLATGDTNYISLFQFERDRILGERVWDRQAQGSGQASIPG
jgi:hypothetical protein